MIRQLSYDRFQNIAFKITFASCILYLFEEIRLYGSLILEKTKHMVQSGHALKKIIIIYHAIQAAGDKGYYELVWLAV